MLVTCAECGARYEVDAALIPSEGRSVQCSSCDHVWTEVPAVVGRTVGLAEDRASYLPPKRSVGGPDGEVPHAPRPPLADEIKAILREEADRETRVRRERGMVDIPPPGGERAMPHQAPQPGTHRPAGALPDPGAINQTLRAASMRAAPEHQPAAEPRRGGFVTGLVLGLCLVGLAALAYIGAPRIAALVPATAAALDDYVATVDTARATLEQAVARATAAVSDLTDG